VKLCDLALFSPETSSGVRTYISNKIQYVNSRADSIQHVVIVPGQEDKVSIEGSTKVIVVRGVPCFYPGLSIAINIGKVADIVEREAPDLIELNCQYTLPLAAFLATQRRRTPIVGVYHTDVPACVRHMTAGAGPEMSAFFEKMVELYIGPIYRHCTLTVILNSMMRPRMDRLGVRRTCCLPCGVDVNTFNPGRADPAFRELHGIGPEQIILLYAGRLSLEKELDVLFDAHSRLCPERFVLLIAGDGPQADLVRERAAAHRSVQYLGHFDEPSDLAPVYASSDIFVIPGRYETFGMSTLEGIASGLAVVGIQDSGTASIVPEEVGILAPAGDADKMATALTAVSQWPRDHVRNVSSSFASDNYSWESVFDRYFKMYRLLIENQ
jgi:alpha-1,6-mannosyltransferase